MIEQNVKNLVNILNSIQKEIDVLNNTKERYLSELIDIYICSTSNSQIFKEELQKYLYNQSASMNISKEIMDALK